MTEDLSRSEESLQPNQSTKDYREPPRTLKGILKYLGPAFATLAVIIGSGELIATTAAGAKIGIIVLWFLISTTAVSSIFHEGATVLRVYRIHLDNVGCLCYHLTMSVLYSLVCHSL